MVAIHRCLGSRLVLHVSGQYEKPGRTREELLPCKEQQHTSAISKVKDHDNRTNTRKINE
jgi:hypothetical protein